MKIRIIPLLFMLFIGIWTIPQKTDAQVSISFQAFYDDLNPYGYWVDNPAYGYVWVPRVAHGFRPYGTNGHWIWTEYGWTWVSNYPWGWAPFHYGRWYYDDNYEWIWVPDDEWGPGWVSWRSSDDYYGWAPIGPGVSIELAYTSGYDLPYNRWTFVPTRYFGRPDINNYYVNNTNNVTIINKTTIINNPQVDRTRNTRFNAGPDRRDVERHTGKTFTPIAVKESDKPTQRVANNQLEIFRPQVQKNSGTKPVPPKVENLKDVKRPVNGKTDNLILPKVQPAKEEKPRFERNNPPVKQQPVQQQPVQRQDNPIKQRPVQEQPKVNPRVRQEPVQQPRDNPPVRQQPVKQPPVQRQREQQQQPIQQQQPRMNPPVRQEPVKQQPVQRQRDQQPVQQQQPKKNEPAFQGPPQQQNPKPVKEQPAPKEKKGHG